MNTILVSKFYAIKKAVFLFILFQARIRKKEIIFVKLGNIKD